ncbi:MAG: hypothetical protein AABX40_01700 [Candidatus Hydrothermarchaeota archaeon]
MERLKRCTFSVALDSLEGLRGVDIDRRGRVDIDGDLGEVQELKLIDGVLLQIRGDKGCLDIDIGIEEIARLLRKAVV